MSEEIRIGVYVCHCGINIASVVDVASVAEYAGTLPGVVIARANKYTCSDPGQELIKADISKFELNRVVVAACSPTMHEKTYRRVLQTTGLNPYLLEMANIREHCAWVNRENPVAATKKAKDAVRAAVMRVALQKPLEPHTIEVNKDTLVVGGGIAGITTSLEIADAGHKVFLVEKKPSIGGHMAQLDKTFPTLDCAACISTPKMSQAGQHPNIELLSYSEVASVSGHAGNFIITVNRKPRYIREKDCKGCGDCAVACPVEISSEFDQGLSVRKAAYRPFPQSVPNTYTIDRRGTPPCRAACPAGVNVQGYTALISKGKFGEALEVVRRTMPFASVCGRVCTHPCENACSRKDVDESVSIRALKRFIADYELTRGRDPVVRNIKRSEKIAVVGSGPAGLACAYDLLKLGYPVTIYEADEKPGGMLRYGIPAYRLPEASLDNDIKYIEELGAEIKTGIKVDSLAGLDDHGFAAVFVACGAWKSQELGIPGESANGVLNALEFLKRVRKGQAPKLGDRVAVIGGGNAAIDSARTAVRLGATEVTVIYRRSRVEMPAIPEEVAAAEAEGVRFMMLAAPVEILSSEGTLSALRCVRMELGEPDASNRRRPVPVSGSEFEVPVNSVIIAAGQSVDRAEFGELERNTNGTVTADPVTLETNLKGVFAGGDAITGAATVIEAIGAGKQAAVSIDRFLNGVDLAANRKPQSDIVHPSLDGIIRTNRAKTSHAPFDNSFTESELTLTEAQAVAESARCLNCAGCSDCEQCVDACEARCIDFDQKTEAIDLEIGNIVVATGFDTFDPAAISRYGYGKFSNVITSLEFERLANASGPTSGDIRLKDGRKPESVAIVHCVGSRDKNHHEYCSQICCMYSLKQAHLIRERTGAGVYQMYIDLRCAGKGYEEFSNRIAEDGVNFVRGKVAEITDKTIGDEQSGKLIVIVEDTLLGTVLRVPVDMVVLAVAVEPQPDAEAVGRLFGLSRSADGFFLERHPKLDPIATMNEGVFIAGCAQGPKDIPQTVAQAQAAAARVLATIAKGKIELEPRVSEVIEENCDGLPLIVSTPARIRQSH
ncbi:heterodisulfide reductase subunit A [Dehalogenimonas formicexedens]|uniref:Heterodisulfide reductase subunit A n=1 Tax=Dehalogenimonas formicexedens TaxID=1839801 RepID=A0A1P8F6X9_9CHLR|nr:FAD-dependent oxidoreductase [Dehalogenimonas formicexedens]APV44234.1 heterodisulfide reductase subunit A [Dehalogenimonas formicexedens]